MISFDEAQVLGWISPFVWPFLRALALFTAMPVLGTRTVPTRVRIGLAALIAFAAQPAHGAEDEEGRVVDLRGGPAHARVLRQAEQRAACRVEQHVGRDGQPALGAARCRAGRLEQRTAADKRVQIRL